MHSQKIEFIEIPVGSEFAYVRFSDNDSANTFLKSNYNGQLSLLEGEEEEKYWEKIENDRIAKLNKEKKKVRGRDKLLKKAEKELGKHIRFDDADL